MKRPTGRVIHTRYPSATCCTHSQRESLFLMVPRHEHDDDDDAPLMQVTPVFVLPGGKRVVVGGETGRSESCYVDTQLRPPFILETGVKTSGCRQPRKRRERGIGDPFSFPPSKATRPSNSDCKFMELRLEERRGLAVSWFLSEENDRRRPGSPSCGGVRCQRRIPRRRFDRTDETVDVIDIEDIEEDSRPSSTPTAFFVGMTVPPKSPRVKSPFSPTHHHREVPPPLW